MAFSPREFFLLFANAINARDATALEPMFHEDFAATIPQSGERSRGFALFWAQLESYPGGGPNVPPMPTTRILGDDDRWAISPGYTVVPLAAPNTFTVVSRVPYPDGKLWYTVMFVEFRDELLYRMETYSAPELAAPLAESIASYGRG